MTWAAAAGVLAWGKPSAVRIAGALVTLGIGSVISLQFNELANVVAVGFGAIAFAVAFFAPRWALLGASGGAALWMLIAPFATPFLLADPRFFQVLPLSGAARVVIWRYVAQRIPENFWFGHGLDASRTAPQLLPVRDGYSVAAIPLHPHSASMQVWFETGAVGAVLAAAALLVGGWTLSRTLVNRSQAAAAAATISAAAVIANLSYGVWQEWWDASMLLAAALVAAAAPGNSSRDA
jgi:O-antigen ligase